MERSPRTVSLVSDGQATRNRRPSHESHITGHLAEGSDGYARATSERYLLSALIRELSATLRGASDDAHAGLCEAIRRGRERLERVEHTATLHNDVTSITLVDACHALLDALEVVAQRVASQVTEAARQERLRIATQLAMQAEAGDLPLAPARSLPAGESRRAVAESVPPLANPLTRQEVAVLQLLAQGASTQQVAEILTISPTTAKKHICNLMEKLDVSDRLCAVVRGHALGLVRMNAEGNRLKHL